MKISVRKVGGHLGVQRPSAQLDTASLSEADRRELQASFDATGFWELPAELPANPDARDALGTIVEVVEDGGRTHSVGFELAAAPAALRAFVSRVRALSSAR